MKNTNDYNGHNKVISSSSVIGDDIERDYKVGSLCKPDDNPLNALFKSIDMEDMNILSEYFKNYPVHSCDYSIGGIYMWKDYYSYRYAIYEDTLFMKGKDPVTGQDIFYFPIGIMDKTRALDILSDYCEKVSSKAMILKVTESPVNNCEIQNKEPSCFIDDWKEYAYNIEQFLGFPGKKMEKKRNHLHYFNNHFPNQKIEPITSGNSGEILDFISKFEESHESSSLFINESEQTKEAIRNFEKYPYFGLVIRVDEKIAGFTFAEKSGDMVFVHVEKGYFEYQGIYQALASALAYKISELYPDVKYLNREEDMGVESLRKSKESYHPSLMIDKQILVGVYKE